VKEQGWECAGEGLAPPQAEGSALCQQARTVVTALDLKAIVQPAGEPSSVVETWAAQLPPFAAEVELSVVVIASSVVVEVEIGPSYHFHHLESFAVQSSFEDPGLVAPRMSSVAVAAGTLVVAAAVVAAAAAAVA